MASSFTLAVGSQSVDLTDHTKYRILASSWDVSTPGQVKLTLLVLGTSATNRADNAAAVQNVLNRAAAAEALGSTATLSVQRNTTGITYYHVTGGSMVPSTYYPVGDVQAYAVTLTCQPYTVGAPYSVSVPGTLSGSGLEIYVPSVPGDVDGLVHLELTDVSPSGVINRIHIARISDPAISGTGSYQPWLDVTANGGSSGADATAYGGAKISRTLTGLTALDVARGVSPGGALYRGRRDVWARVSGTGTALSTPTGLAAAVDNAQITSLSTQSVNLAAIPAIIKAWNGHQQRTAGAGGDTSGTVTITTDVDIPAGSGLVAIVTARGLVGTTAAVLAAPAGFALRRRTYTNSATTPVRALYDYASCPHYAVGSTFTFTISGLVMAATAGNWFFTVDLYAFSGTDATLVARDHSINAISGSATADSTNLVLADGISVLGEPVIAWVGYNANQAAQDVSNLFTGWNQGFIEQSDVHARAWAYGSPSQILTDVTTNVATTDAISPQPTPNLGLMVGINPQTTITNETTVTYEDPVPGALKAGTYTARVQAIDAVNGRSAATASVTATVSTDQSAITWSWTGVTNAVAYALAVQYGTDVYEVIVSGTSYLLTDLTQLALIAALPSTGAATGPAPFAQAMIRTLNDITTSPAPEVQTDGTGSAQLLRLAADRMLPPVGANLNGDWVDWAVEVRERSANGQSATGTVDALWIVPSREPQAVIWAYGLTLATKRRWVIETHRSGRGTVAWLEDTTTGAEAGRLLTSGAPLVAPGNNLLLLAVEQAAGAHVLSAALTVTLTVYPRFRWERGT